MWEIVKRSDIPKGWTKMTLGCRTCVTPRSWIGHVAAVRVPGRILDRGRDLTIELRDVDVGGDGAGGRALDVKIGDRQERVGVTHIQHKKNT